MSGPELQKLTFHEFGPIEPNLRRFRCLGAEARSTLEQRENTVKSFVVSLHTRIDATHAVDGSLCVASSWSCRQWELNQAMAVPLPVEAR